MPKRLHDDDWGIETNCSVCEPTDAAGLQIPFFHDTDRDVVSTGFGLSRAFRGIVFRGGVTLAVLDEAMAWACDAVGHQWAVTTRTTTRSSTATNAGVASSTSTHVPHAKAEAGPPHAEGRRGRHFVKHRSEPGFDRAEDIERPDRVEGDGP